MRPVGIEDAAQGHLSIGRRDGDLHRQDQREDRPMGCARARPACAIMLSSPPRTRAGTRSEWHTPTVYEAGDAARGGAVRVDARALTNPLAYCYATPRRSSPRRSCPTSSSCSSSCSSPKSGTGRTIWPKTSTTTTTSRTSPRTLTGAEPPLRLARRVSVARLSRTRAALRAVSAGREAIRSRANTRETTRPARPACGIATRRAPVARGNRPAPRVTLACPGLFVRWYGLHAEHQLGAPCTPANQSMGTPSGSHAHG